MFWNSGKSTPAPLSGVRGVLDNKVTQSDGAKLCKIQTEEIIGAGDKTRDLNNNHHLLLAGGPYSAGTLGYHVGNKVAIPLYLPSIKSIPIKTSQVSTDKPLALARVTRVGLGRGDLLYRLHGALMLVAWLGCAGAGMIIAR